jgi:DNA repair exonuclease SbcCD ATPase subunit
MNESKLDIDRAKSLVEEISENLAALPQDNAKYAELRAEVEDLKAMLGRADAHLPQIEDRMKSVHALSDQAATELRADGIRIGIYLREIGRMLGLD